MPIYLAFRCKLFHKLHILFHKLYHIITLLAYINFNFHCCNKVSCKDQDGMFYCVCPKGLTDRLSEGSNIDAFP